VTPRRLWLGTLAAALLAPAAPAMGVDGNLYPFGSSIWAAGAQFTATQSGETWTIAAPELADAWPGSKWEMNWGCPVGGSEIAAVRWSALRTAAPSSLEQHVSVHGQVLWAAPDAAIPQSPAGGLPFEILLPPGVCNVHLKLAQTEQRHQHARAYFIDHPRIVVRDVSPPTAVIRAVTGGWIRAGVNRVRVDWSASDNFGADGMTVQGISVAGIGKWAAIPGQGDFAAELDLDNVPDGVQNVHLDVLGDGTPMGSADAWIYVDRTAPGTTGLGLAYSGRPGHASFAWTPLDGTSGVASSEIQLARATDGAEAGEWVPVVTRTGDAAQYAPDVPVTGAGDGVHAWRVVTVDGAGNAGVTTGLGKVLVDTTPPAVDLAPLPTAYVSSLPIDLVAHDNLEGAVGLGATEVEVNTAADGGAGGAWRALAAEPRSPGRQTFSLPIGGLADGPHAVRVRVRNGGPFGATLVTERAGQVNVDLTSPEVSAAAFTASGPSSLAVAFTANDRLSGVASATVQWDRGGGWETLLSTPSADGARTLSVDTRSVPDGSRRFRLLVADAAGNVTAVTGPAGLSVDHAAPSVTGIGLQHGPQGWLLSWSQYDPIGGFGACPTSVQVSGPGTEGAWRELAALQAAEGPQSVLLPVDGLAPGAYRVRVVACDAAGGTAAAETGGLLISAPPSAAGSSDAPAGTGAGRTAPDPFARLRNARLEVGVDGARSERVRGRLTLVKGLRFGERLRVRGRLTAANGAAIRRTQIQVRGLRGRVLGRVLTGRDGRFVLTVRPEASGPLQIGAPAGSELLPARRPVGVRVTVRPIVTLAASRRQAFALGAPVIFTGRVQPAPALLGGSTRKGVVLEWRDPLRRAWRPVLNARVRRDGRFRLAWRFGVRDLTIPMRVRVPVERGWPLQPAITKAIPIIVR
jgi:hypothetical protein